MTPSAKSFFTQEQKDIIEKSIVDAENKTSGEIRVHIENNCPDNVLDRAAYMFEKLKMHKTSHRNGVLFYLALNNKKFAILGDAGINKVVAPDFWDNIKSIMQEYFAKNEFTEGLSKGIAMAGEKLKIHFPSQATDSNELPDEISFGND